MSRSLGIWGADRCRAKSFTKRAVGNQWLGRIPLYCFYMPALKCIFILKCVCAHMYACAHKRPEESDPPGGWNYKELLAVNVILGVFLCDSLFPSK